MIDFNYKTNQLIVLVTLAASAVGWLMTGALLSGLSIGVGVFLTWALAREIDPKHDYSALLAAGFALINLFYYESLQLLIIGWLLLVLRMVNGLCGKAVTVFDMLLVLGLTTYLSFSNENSIYLVAFLLALYLVSKGRKLTMTLVIINAIASVLFLVQSFFLDYLNFNSISDLNMLSTVSLTLLGLSFILFWFLSKEDAQDDQGNKANRARVLSGQVLYSASVLLLIFFGTVSLNNLIIYASVILAILLYYIGSKLVTAFQ
ncbi:hypothetical protein SAMN04488102_102196 [Alkalibacterium subtropicum]|uniref:Uncharacterized protein n=1 Tax=Alkalibacterium subtropicum TaxID=753702 RepID=A0A1I1FUP5_9LACT|nr:hypothetical protein [Alkalibacterium subtropicum]SFC01358.1 hypothetical protein SAMN04488102_102196 [Alkalibacterium subtropicum]